jgi:hypothetical protein
VDVTFPPLADLPLTERLTALQTALDAGADAGHRRTIRLMRALVVDLAAVTDAHGARTHPRLRRRLGRRRPPAGGRSSSWPTARASPPPGCNARPGSPPRCRPSPTSSTTWPRTPRVVISDGAGQTTSIALTAQAAIAGSSCRRPATRWSTSTGRDRRDRRRTPSRSPPAPGRSPRPGRTPSAGPRAGRRGGGQPGEGRPGHGAARPRRRRGPAGGPRRGDLPHRAERRRPRRHPGLGSRQRATLQGWEWLSSRSKTTCPACWAQDGTIHELDETGPDGHVNCRCTRMVRTKTWRELGIDLDEPAGLPHLRRGPLPDPAPATSCRSWAPARLKALDDGAPWSSLATEKPNADWRRSFQITRCGTSQVA